jgi:hypothetical protein
MWIAITIAIATGIFLLVAYKMGGGLDDTPPGGFTNCSNYRSSCGRGCGSSCSSGCGGGCGGGD